MTKVFLHGKLKRDYGAELNYSVESTAEVFLAMSANKKGFKKRIIDDAKRGLFYDIVADGIRFDTPEDLAQSRETPKIVHVFPVISGAEPVSTIAAISAVVGSVAVATTIYYVGSMVLFAVVSGLISSMFAPKAAKPQQSIVEASAGLNSYYFGGRVNRAQQGQPIPIVYGDLKVASYVIQAGVRNLKKSEFELL